MSLGGDASNNSITEEARRKISESKKGISYGPLPEEVKRKISLSNKGKVRTPEQRQRIKDSRDYPSLPESHRQAISEGLRKTRKYSLTPSQVDTIEFLIPYVSTAYLCYLFEVSSKTIWRIKHGLYYR